MQKKWVPLIVSVVAASAIVIASTSFASSPIKLVVNGKTIATDVPPQIIKNRTMVPIRSAGEALGAKVGWNQETRTVTIDRPNSGSDQRQIELLNQWVAAKSPEGAVQTWAEAIKNRNGAVQFAMLAPDLQKKTRKQFESLNWVTGVSSPWVDSFTVSNDGKTGQDQLSYSVLFKLATSTGSAGEGTLKATVRKSDDTWSLIGIQPGKGGESLGITVLP
ncbi:copper amine oxidase N-terminal domain-containing protein [Cohnella pontilimi]|uniref:Copper amine oxidase N-terminal domain-containing protein n=1 Tax=Cohnella pontilimi TaxID=2564100 RepID=A0A4U0F9W5_9BACL|nr:copper amine oxidase N-terminal domain-containing protein [Cohnella pontilimi]TJY41308.1 copper amine oxidase N-terminal domain-containing protein [Cohnella pontilimi]